MCENEHNQDRTCASSSWVGGGVIHWDEEGGTWERRDMFGLGLEHRFPFLRNGSYWQPL